MRLPFFRFVNYLLTTLNRAPGQLLPIGGWLNITIFEVACRMGGVEPTVSLFSALFSVSHKSFETKFSACPKRNILAGTRPNRIKDTRLHKKWFYARGGMAEGAPRIWTLKEEARGLPPCTAEDLHSLQKEISSIAASTQPQLVSFDNMLMDRPSLFTRVAIVTKTKPRESFLSKVVSSSPPPTTTVPIPAINPFLKRMATAAPSMPPPKKAKKAVPSKKKVLARDTSSEESQSQEIQPIVGAEAHPANIVALDFSTTISDRDVSR
ncbi:hypothetical protein LIER_29213 [Lithospermum erythrorhizon]|uniref:Uncharacterized protein n=1 Tax=Lithospermum erythrorhizon TaxID=34254 RepID=A0AAV3RIV0_LITER